MSIHELQARLKALDEAREARSECDAGMWALASVKVDEAEWEVEQAARRVADGAGEPVAWQIIRGGRVISSLTRAPVHGEVAHDEGESVRCLYTIPSSADALIELLEMKFNEVLADTANERSAHLAGEALYAIQEYRK